MTARAALAQSLAQVRASLEGGRTRDPHTRIRTRAEAYRFIERTLERFDYFRQGKARKGILRYLLREVTGLSRAQITRLLNQHRTTGRLRDHRGAPRRPFASRYTAADIELLAELDALHGELPGPLARELCARAWRLFGDRRFERLAGVSNGHIYNLRRSTTYRRRRDTVPSACGLVPWIGERRRLQRFSRPGHMRVISVFSRAVVGAGSLYALHLQDEVTQFQFVGCAERLRAPSLAPVVDDARRALPFPLLDFHAARGSQRTTREVAALLAALHAEHPEPGEQSEPAGDLAAARRKDAARTAYLVTHYIPAGYAVRFGTFNRQVLAPYLNYHRLRYFPLASSAGTGRRRRCRQPAVLTPYERFRSLPEAARYLKPGVTFAQLDAVATAMSDNEAARALNEAAARLFGSVVDGLQPQEEDGGAARRHDEARRHVRVTAPASDSEQLDAAVAGGDRGQHDPDRQHSENGDHRPQGEPVVRHARHHHQRNQRLARSEHEHDEQRPRRDPGRGVAPSRIVVRAQPAPGRPGGVGEAEADQERRGQLAAGRFDPQQRIGRDAESDPHRADRNR